MALLSAWRPGWWPLWLLPLLPALGLMTWSGWILVEETDLMVLAVAAGGWMRLAAGWPATGAKAQADMLRGLMRALLWFVPLLLATIIGVERGVADAGGWAWGWWQGYREPLNSLRLAKPLFEVLLLLPLWRAACLTEPEAAPARLRWALVAMLGVVALSVVWERAAFTGLANFSTDYRATGSFWEMHVGGAALDVVLSLSIPFTAAALLAATTPLRMAAAALVLALALYAALATFSRIVYFAVPLALMVWAVLRARGVALRQPTLPALPWVAGFGIAAWLMFPTGGYRGLLALLGATTLLLPLAAQLRGLRTPQWALGGVVGLVLAAIVALIGSLPKGAYVAFALVWCGAAVSLIAGQARPRGGAGAGALAFFIAVLAGLVAVSVGWGGAPAWPAAAAVAAAMLAIAVAAGRRSGPSWPEGARWQGLLLAMLVAVSGVVGVFGGGAYMGERLSAVSQDSKSRQAHWEDALRMLRGTDWLLGRGLGRFWDSQFLSGRPDDYTGDYRLLAPAAGRDGAAVVLTSGRHELGGGALFRFSQRVSPAFSAAPLLRLRLRNDAPVKIEAEVCSKHLLYPSDCSSAQVGVAGKKGIWQSIELRFKGEMPGGGAWYAPQLIVFSIALGSNLNHAEIDDIELIDASGANLLSNGHFERGLAHWYFSSDRLHLPFHAKNMALHLLFEQGLLGLLAASLLLAGAIWRVSLGAARRHVLAPALAAALVGVLVVGLADSVLDMPRAAFLTWLLAGLALSLPAGRNARSDAGSDKDGDKDSDKVSGPRRHRRRSRSPGPAEAAP